MHRSGARGRGRLYTVPAQAAAGGNSVDNLSRQLARRGREASPNDAAVLQLILNGIGHIGMRRAIRYSKQPCLTQLLALLSGRSLGAGAAGGQPLSNRRDLFRSARPALQFQSARPRRARYNIFFFFFFF